MRWLLIYSGIVMTIFGLYILRIGIFGLAKKRPLAYSARTVMWLFFLYILPNSIKLLVDLFRHWDPVLLFLLVLMIMLVVFIWRDRRGYIVAGIYDRTFREALAWALNKLKIRPEETILKRRFQETTTRMRLVELDADLHAVIVDWNGSARIHIKQSKHAQLIKPIAEAMNNYFSSTSVKVNNIGFIVQLLLGIFMVGMGAVFVFAS